MEVKTMPSESDFQDFVGWLKDCGLTAEAHQDAKGRVCGLRFYAGGVLFVVTPETIEDGQVRLRLDRYEYIEPEDRMGHVLDVIDRLDGI